MFDRFQKQIPTLSEIPRELVREARGAEVHVKMVDKRTEEFKEPKVIIRPFSGSGFKLGRSANNLRPII